MTVKEAILTLNANVVIACERAGFSSETVKMIEDALDIIEDALNAQEPTTAEPKRIELADETKAWLDEMDAVDALNNIADICIDWDGYRTANGLGGLINEIWAYARYGADRLLKAQEPRVVKISELTAGEPMLVWLEDIDKEETVAGMIFDYVPGRLGFKLTDLASMDRIYPRIEDYLTRWRCWTSRPDKATREATPWQGSSNL